jgi:acetyltransferase-like isoleucine patch superfamily enzyme
VCKETCNMKILSVISNIIRQIKHTYELRRYTPYTIAEYFRKQGAQIGTDCMIVPTRLGTEPYLIKIGNRVGIAEGVKFMTHDGGPWIFRNEITDIQVFGPIIIEDNCIVGQNAVIFPNVRIGKNSIVGAGSVVISDVPPDTIVMGVPARPFGSVLKYKEKCFEKWKQQKPPDVVIAKGETWWTAKSFDNNRQKLQNHLKKLFEAELS